MSDGGAIERFVASGAAYSDPAVARLPGRLIEVSGQLGLDPDGAIPASFEQEVALCFEGVRESLARAGAGFEDVLRIRAYLTDLSQYQDYAEGRARAFGSSPPASTAVGVGSLLLGASLEIEATAFVVDP